VRACHRSPSQLAPNIGITVSEYLLVTVVEKTFTPGAAISTVFLPQLEKVPNLSAASIAATEIILS